MKSTIEIRRELKKLIDKKKIGCTTEKEINKSVNDARMEINAKYGKGWREQVCDGIVYQIQRNSPDIYSEHTFGEHWMD